MPQITRFFGVNTGDAATEIHDQESTICQNLFLSGRSLELRGGNSEAFADSTVTNKAVVSLHRAYISSTPFWFYTLDDNIMSTVTGAQVQVAPTSASGDRCEFVEAAGNVYILRRGLAV